MSSAAVVPPPNSSSLLRHVPRLTAQARALLTAMNLHFAGVAALGVLVLYLAAHLVFVGQALNSSNQDALDQQRNELRAAEIGRSAHIDHRSPEWRDLRRAGLRAEFIAVLRQRKEGLGRNAEVAHHQ